MNRLVLFTIPLVLTAGMGGCVETIDHTLSTWDEPTVQPIDPSSPITDRSLTIESGVHQTGEEDQELVPREHWAAVDFDDSSSQVVVRGHIPSGGLSCKETVLQKTAYDEETGTLTVTVFHNHIESEEVCTAEMATVAYTATVRFEETLPGRVVVEHYMDSSGVAFTETIER